MAPTTQALGDNKMFVLKHFERILAKQNNVFDSPINRTKSQKLLHFQPNL
jgi:hypothetical protein